MARLHKPYALFSLTQSIELQLTSSLERLAEECTKGRSRYYKMIQRHFEDIDKTSQWALMNQEELVKYYPRTKRGDIKQNSHQVIREFISLSGPANPWMGSRGFEGTNLRIVLKSDKEGQIELVVGEYKNLSGKLLSYREGLPYQSSCQICSSELVSGNCRVCGRTHCDKCNHLCIECGNAVCMFCHNGFGEGWCSPHHWHFHK